MSLRASAADLQIEVAFDCDFEVASLRPQHLPYPLEVRLSTITVDVPKLTPGRVSTPIGVNALCVNRTGALLARHAGAASLLLIPPRSVAFVKGGAELRVQAARGAHSLFLATWQAGMAPVLEAWIAGRTRTVAVRPVDPELGDEVGRLLGAQDAPDDLFEPLLLGVIHELTARLLSGRDQLQLATIPPGLPDTIVELVREVRANSAANWPLKDAADRAGYSPFHFSRVFKSLIGYGFHEYVDRCRTETAVDLLVNGTNGIDLVASASGFGTTQGLRESLKEYLGLVPSELRNFPEFAPRGS